MASGGSFPRKVHGVKNDYWGKIGQLIWGKFGETHKWKKTTSTTTFLVFVQENDISLPMQ